MLLPGDPHRAVLGLHRVEQPPRGVGSRERCHHQIRSAGIQSAVGCRRIRDPRQPGRQPDRPAVRCEARPADRAARHDRARRGPARRLCLARGGFGQRCHRLPPVRREIPAPSGPRRALGIGHSHPGPGAAVRQSPLLARWRRMALGITEPSGAKDIWVLDVAQRTWSRLTTRRDQQSARSGRPTAAVWSIRATTTCGGSPPTAAAVPRVCSSPTATGSRVRSPPTDAPWCSRSRRATAAEFGA